MKHLPLRECGYAIAVVVVLLVLYGGAYLALSTKVELDFGTYVDYRFGGEWSATIFEPAHDVDRFLRADFWRAEIDADYSRWCRHERIR